MTPEVSAIQDAPLRIAILAPGARGAGGLTVCLNMVAAFGRVAPEHEYFCVVPEGSRFKEAVGGLPRCEVLIYSGESYLGRWRFETLVMPKAVEAFRPDVVFAVAGFGLLKPGCPQAAFPQQPHLFYPPKYYGHISLSGRLMHWYKRRYFTRQLRRTQLALVQTAVVERRLREEYNYRGRTMVCGTSVSPFLATGHTGRPVPEVLRPLRDKIRLLYLTRYYPHKNLEGIVELVRRHGDELRDVVFITTIGPDQHPSAAKYIRKIDDYRLGNQIINVGPIAHADVAAFYEHCDALFMPTLLESFGIPYLEAMHFDLPILTSNLDFAHAVCGDAALFFDPWDMDSMRDSILRLKSDSELRERLVTAGRERRAKQFPTWDGVAKQVLQELRAIAKG